MGNSLTFVILIDLKGNVRILKTEYVFLNITKRIVENTSFRQFFAQTTQIPL